MHSDRADAAEVAYGLLDVVLDDAVVGGYADVIEGEDGRLEQRWVQTGRDLWGSYTQIRGGLTIDDYVAFPYGRDVVEGAHTQEATTDQLYNYGI